MQHSRKLLFWIVIIALSFSCKDNESKGGLIVPKQVDQVKEFKDVAERNKEERLYTYPRFISESLIDVELVHRPWEPEFLFCRENERPHLVKAIDSNRYVMISRGGAQKYFFYDLLFDGTVKSRIVLNGKPESCFNENYNFLSHDGAIHYYISVLDSMEYRYDLETHSHEIADQRVLNWEVISRNAWDMCWQVESPSGRFLAKIKDVGLQIIDHQNSTIDSFISQKYSGTWAIGMGSWSLDNSKFYFDNSGAVACIWELDIVNKTLDKIVPEHHAGRPSFIPSKSVESVLYVDGNCVKRVVKKSKLSGIL